MSTTAAAVCRHYAPTLSRCAGSEHQHCLGVQAELKRVREQSEAHIQELLDKMADSDRKARSAEEYLSKREGLLAELALLKVQVADEQHKGEVQLRELERQHVQDRCASSACCMHAAGTPWSSHGPCRTRSHCGGHTVVVTLWWSHCGGHTVVVTRSLPYSVTLWWSHYGGHTMVVTLWWSHSECCRCPG